MKLIEIPVIELTDFREKVLAVTRVAVRNILDSVRSNKDNIKIDTILPLIKIALVGQPAPAGRLGEPVAPQKAFIDLNEQE